MSDWSGVAGRLFSWTGCDVWTSNQSLGAGAIALGVAFVAHIEGGRRRARLGGARPAVVWLLGAIGLLFAVIPNLIGSEDLETALPGMFLFIMGYWQLTPLLTLSLGVSLDMRRTRVYPVSTATLFTVECGLRLGTGAEMLLILAGLWAGFATAGSMSLSALTAGFALFILFNMFISAAIRNFVERLFRQRHLREVVVVVMVCFLLAPQALIWSQTLRQIARDVLLASRDIPHRALPSGLAA